MAQAGMPNPIELYECARDYMIPILGGVQASQLTGATPCTEWNVQQLITHNIKVADNVHGSILGNNTTNPMEVDDPLPSEGAREAFAAGTSRVLDLVKTNDLSKVIDTPFGQMPIGDFLMFPIMDIVIHRWDLAKGTNQDSSIDSGLAEACYPCLQMGAEGGRQAGVFASEVTLPISASIQDKLLALSGRTP